MTRKLLLPMILASGLGLATAVEAASVGVGVGVGGSAGAQMGGRATVGAGVHTRQDAEVRTQGLERSMEQLQSNLERAPAEAEQGLNTAIDAHTDAMSRQADETESTATDTTANMKAKAKAKVKAKAKADATASGSTTTP